MTEMNIAEVLAFERNWWKFQGAKEDVIRGKFGLTPTRYCQQLNQILDTAEALAVDPVTVNRLRRIATSKQRRLP